MQSAGVGQHCKRIPESFACDFPCALVRDVTVEYPA
jgi:hypothetical protein